MYQMWRIKLNRANGTLLGEVKLLYGLLVSVLFNISYIVVTLDR